MNKYLKIHAAKNDSEQNEILVHGPIGSSFWDDSGISGKDFTDALNKFPKGTKVTIGVNSQGGEVGQGLAIYNAIKRRADDITVRIDGYAISIASVFPLAASKVISPQSSIWMIHNVWAWAGGNAEEMRKQADILETHDETLVGIYAAKTGKSEKEIKDAMAEETWFNGQEAIDWGLADESSDEDVADALNSLDFSKAPQAAFKNVPAFAAFKNLPAALGGAGATNKSKNAHRPPPPTGGTTNQTMNKEKIVALLKTHGIEASVDESIEALEAKLEKALAKKPEPEKKEPAKPDPEAKADDEVKAELKRIKAQLEAERVNRVTRQIDQLVVENKLTVDEAKGWLPKAIADESILDELAKRQPILAGAEPLPVSVEGDASSDDVVKAVGKTNEPIAAMFKGNRVAGKDIHSAAVKRAEILNKHGGKLRGILNANTIDTALKRQVILNDVMRAFKRRLIPLNAFSTVFANVPLLGTAKVNVPYYALHTTTSTDYSSASGYVFNGTSDTSMKEITVDKRKYQPFDFSSEEFRRQPFFNVQTQAELRAEQLGVDVFNDVLSAVTLANYGAAAKTEPSAAFDTDDIVDLMVICDQADWPEAMRSLLLDSAYAGNVLKDLQKNALQGGNDGMLRTGAIGNISGFQTFKSPRIPGNSENLVGMAVHPSGLIVATSPIQPAPGVLRNLLSYDVVVDPDTGIAFEYRYWGEAQPDKDYEVIEANYGYAKGEAAGIKRITSA